MCPFFVISAHCQQHFAALETIFRYYATRDSQASKAANKRLLNHKHDGSHNEAMCAFWRQKSKVVMDDTMNFNECLQFLDECQLFDSTLHNKVRNASDQANRA